jgi:glycerophosphoryl diester phosphodiesterase
MRLTSQVAVWDDFDRANAAPGTTSWGVTWKQAAANFVISSNALVKLTGSSTNRYFGLLPGPGANVEINALIRTNATTNLTDLGFALRSLDSTASRGGQLYVSLRKTSGANSIRIIHRTDTSGSDTVLATNAAAGWADNTDYTIRIVSNGTSVEVFVDGVSKLAHTLSGGVHAALTGTDVGVSFTNTDTGSKIYDFYVLDSAMPTTPTVTTTKVLCHRGTPWDAADTTEEQLTGLALLPAAVNGPEVDARKTSDGDYYLCHDTTFDRTSPTSATGSCTNATTATWIAAGMCEVGDYLDACQTYAYGDVIVQFEMSLQAHMTNLVALINAHPMRDRVIVMTSATSPSVPSLAEIRAAGWEGQLGCYGLTVANWAAGLDDDFATYDVDLGFLALGDDGYDANTALISTLHTAGHLVGASTITPNRFVAAVTAGVDIVLTDMPAEFLAAYDSPANPSFGSGSALMARPHTPNWSIDRTFHL